MVLRLLLRYFANNEQLVQKLSESYPVRRAAQLAVSVFYRTKNITDNYKLQEMTPERFKSFLSNFKTNIEQEIEGAKNELKKKKF